jgi:hypothetical protein
MTLAFATQKSGNRKTGPIAVTHAAQQSCPASCPFLNSGCYAENGPQGIHTRRLNEAAADATPIDVALAEAAAINELSAAPALRLHVVGDCASDEAAVIVSDAAARFQERGGGPTWTYTHAWADVDRKSWGTVSVLASCETPEQVAEAHERGYAACIVTEKHDSTRRYELDGIEVIPCPQQTREDLTCADCLLCTRDDYLRSSKRVIAFAAHGATKLIATALRRQREAYAQVR